MHSLDSTVINVFDAFHDNRSMVDSVDLDSQKGGRHAPGNAARQVVDIELDFHFDADFRVDYRNLVYKNEKKLILEVYKRMRGRGRGRGVAGSL